MKIEHYWENDDIFGENWFGYQKLYESIVKEFKSGSKFVEVGCWKGRSSSFLAVEIANSDKDISLYCVDTWEGSIEHTEEQGLSSLYDTFINNMKPVENYYFPLKLTSLEAAKKFEDNSLDFVFLDASHEYEDVKKDIQEWLPKVKPGGILAGHDYYLNEDWFVGVKQAVNEEISNFIVEDNCWIYRIPENSYKDIEILFSASNKDEIWESDYILDTLLPNNVNKIPVFIQPEYIDLVNDNYDVFVYNCRKHNYNQILEVVKKIKPKIIIHLSDEYHYENLSEYNNLAKYCNLFLRQHHHPGFEYDDNAIQIPLGYCNGAGVEGQTISKVSDRYLNWSFIGDMKHDRWEMVEKFKTIPNNFVGSSIGKNQMMKIYLNSIFVPNGRGNSSLNCFRLYEASMSGGIPVVVGNPDEIDCTFKYEESPPWLFFNSWDEASSECSRLLEDKESLQKIQDNVLAWWSRRINGVCSKVENALNGIKIENNKLEGLRVLQVGSNRGYDGLSEYIKENYSSIEFGLFVEANPIHMDSLKECYSQFDNVHFENLAVTYPRRSADPSEIEMFYHVDDGPNYELATTDIQNIKWHTHLPGNIPRETVEDFNNVYNDKIQSFKVPCSTLDSLLRRYNIQELDLVVLDTEGIDAFILFSTDWEKFNIYRVEFEYLHLHDYKKAVERMFIGMGYERVEPLFPNDNWCFENKKLKEQRSIESCKNKLKNFPKVHYITIADDSRRRDLLEKKFEKYGIGKENLIPHIFERYKDEDHHLVSNFLDQIGWYRLSFGSRGPLTSHLKAIKEWYNNTDEPYAIFCEDDLGLDTVKYWNFTWEEFFNNLPENWGCVQLVLLRETYENYTSGFKFRAWDDWSACAYLLSREHARKLIESYYYDDSFFDIDVKGVDEQWRPDWAKLPVVETIMFSTLTPVYVCPLFVEDVVNCSSTYVNLMGLTEGQCDEHHYHAYYGTINWWRETARHMSLKELTMI